jgi:hypothetical protein
MLGFLLFNACFFFVSHIKKFCLLILVIFLIVGSILIWQSTTFKTCDNWASIDNYKYQKCDYRANVMAALENCNLTMPCVCQNPTTHVLSCLNMPPYYGHSIAFLIPGIILMTFAVSIGIGLCIFKYRSE